MTRSARPASLPVGPGWPAMSLKRRVMLVLLALVALFTLLQGSLAVLSLHDQEDELVDQLVATEAQRLATRLQAMGPQAVADPAVAPLPDHYQAWWQAPDGRSLPGPVPARLARLPDGPHRDTAGGMAELHVMVMPAAGGRLFLQFNAEQNEAKVREFGWQTLMLGLVFLVVAAWLARHLAGQLVAPLGRVTRLLDHWAPAPPGEAPAAADEENRLLDAFARVQSRWEQGLARESEILANLRHEVRTPLTALRTDLELLLSSASGSGPLAADAAEVQARRARLQRAITAVDAVASALQTVQSLDAGLPGAAQWVALADCVADAWASLGDLPADRGLVLHNDVPPLAGVRADRHALLTILRNLMRNAAEHAAPAHCRVALVAGRLVVEDDGPGVATDELPFVFERYYRGRLADAPGAEDGGQRGLGLAIARQVAHMQGWGLSANAVRPHGLGITLDFGSARDIGPPH